MQETHVIIERVGSIIKKKYHRSVLLVGDEELYKRTKLITKLSDEYETIPKTRFHWEGEFLILEQKKLYPILAAEKSCNELINFFLSFAKEMDKISLSIVHGDITKKNIILNKNKIYLIDWEPCLKQIRRGYSTLLYTEPYLSLNDIKNNILSYETDKIAFFFSCLYILYRRRPLGVIREIVLARKKQAICITPIHESTFVLLNFQELVNLAIENKNWKLN